MPSNKELRESIRWMAQTVHQAHHTGPIEGCKKSVCDHAAKVLAEPSADEIPTGWAHGNQYTLNKAMNFLDRLKPEADSEHRLLRREAAVRDARDGKLPHIGPAEMAWLRAQFRRESRRRDDHDFMWWANVVLSDAKG